MCQMSRLACLSSCFPLSCLRSPVYSGLPLHPGPKLPDLSRGHPEKTNRLAYLITSLAREDCLPSSFGEPGSDKKRPRPASRPLGPQPSAPSRKPQPLLYPLPHPQRKTGGREAPTSPGSGSHPQLWAPAQVSREAAGATGASPLGGDETGFSVSRGHVPSSPHEVPVINTEQAEGPERGR